MTPTGPETQRKNYVACNLCGADDAKDYLHVEGFRIVRCMKCDLIYVNPRLTDDAIHDIYNKNYFNAESTKPYYKNYLGEKSWRSIEQEKEVIRLTKMKKPGKLLEFGCAFGFFLEMARKHGWVPSGVEIPRQAGEHARAQGFDVFVGPFLDSNFPEGTFDAIHADGVIEHLPDPRENVRRCAALLKRGGILVLGTPNIASFCSRVYRAGFRLLEPNAHLYYFSPKTLSALLEKEGFRIVKIRYPYFNSPYCNRKELLELLKGLWKIGVEFPVRRLLDRSFKAPVLKSPPFYGNRMMIYAEKR